MTDWAILDTSWLLEPYQVPRHSQKDRYEEVLGQAREAAQGWMLVTVPVLFEFANHIVQVGDGDLRRCLITQYSEHVSTSLTDRAPWTVIPRSEDDILLRAKELAELADRFVELSGGGYSLADISIVDLTLQLRKRKQSVRILTFDKQLEAYSD